MTDTQGKPDATRKRRRRRRKPAGGGAKGGVERTASDSASKPKSSTEPRPRRRRSRKRRGDAETKNTTESRPQPATQQPATQQPATQQPVSAPRSVDAGWDPTPPPPPDLPTQATQASNLAQADDPAALAPGDAPWGDDSQANCPDIQLGATLPTETASDLDPSSGLEPGYQGVLSARVSNVIAVRFVRAGRLYLYDGGDEVFAQGDAVLVEGDRGKRIAIVGTASRRQPPKRTLKKILRRAKDADQEPQRAKECQAHLRIAKELAKKQGLSIKVFRAEFEGPSNLCIYYSCEHKTDVRGLARALGKEIPVRVDLRHTGSRDEAKMVGGIGSCGQELCCSTWLPAFVPVSIKNAKDQGLALNPTKLSGQCGRLKCCLVYEQALYSEMRKGLPKLGKRVITHDGLEGRVIEVDVLHQRIRVSIGRGESKLYGKGEVKPMFASQPQSGQGTSDKKRKRKRDTPHDGSDPVAEPDNTTKNESKDPSHDKD